MCRGPQLWARIRMEPASIRHRGPGRALTEKSLRASVTEVLVGEGFEGDPEHRRPGGGGATWPGDTGWAERL